MVPLQGLRDDFLHPLGDEIDDQIDHALLVEAIVPIPSSAAIPIVIVVVAITAVAAVSLRVP